MKETPAENHDNIIALLPQPQGPIETVYFYPQLDVQAHNTLDTSPRKKLCFKWYRFALVFSIIFYSILLGGYIPFVVGIVQSKYLVVSAYLFGFIFFAPQIYLAVEELKDVMRMRR